MSKNELHGLRAERTLSYTTSYKVTTPNLPWLANRTQKKKHMTEENQGDADD